MLVLSTLTFSQIYPTKVQKPVHFDKSIRLDQIDAKLSRDIDMSWKDGVVKNQFGFKDEFKSPSKWKLEDPVLQKDYSSDRSNPIILHNFPGQDNISGVAPPDTQGDVGLNYYIQMVNLHTEIFDKDGNSVWGPYTSNTFWDGFDDGTPYDNTNSGDPIVLYDEYADRWIVSQFALPNYPSGPFYELIAVSETSDPLGSWYRYAYEFTNMPDYPKLGVWTDGYYFTINQFAPPYISWAGAGVAVVDRAAMLVGNATANMIFFDLGMAYGSLLPADADGPTTPLTQSAYLAELSTNQIYIWGTNINWGNPSSSTCNIVRTIPTASFNTSVSIEQPGTTTSLMGITDRLMYRLQYRNFGTYEAMVTNHTVNADGNGKAGVRWYEFRDYGSGWNMYQQGTYSPDDDNRWMGSIAMNGNGDIALGYSLSSSSTYPSINFVGQNSESTGTGIMDVIESTPLSGTASQTGINRWGDYSMMSIDPSDDESFWYTQEYSSGAWNWKTQIIHFTFAPITDPPVVNFEADDILPIIGQDVTFYDLSTNVPNTWNWSFSPTTITYINSTNSNSKNPQIQFNNSGLYTVSLTASNDIGSDSETKIDYIYVVDCSNKITIYPYLETFNEWEISSPEMSCTSNGSVPFDDCWVNATGDYIDWDIYTGNTPSGDTGPDYDVFPFGDGNYLYTESSNCFNHNGIVLTPIFDLTTINNPEVSFYYHMYGSSMGSLSFSISINGGTTWTELWSVSGQQSVNGGDWKNFSTLLNSYTSENNIRFKFEAITGSNWHSDIAIDYFEINSADVTKWIGTTSEWETISNWTNDVPTPTMNAIIQSGYEYPYITNSSNGESKNLIIEPSMKVYVGASNTNRSLTVYGNLNIQSNNGLIIEGGSEVTVLGNTNLDGTKSIIVKSSEYGTGSFIDNGTITYINNATAEVQTWISNSSSPSSYYLHQVGTSISDPDFYNQYGFNGVYLQGFDLHLHGTYAYLYDEPTAEWINIWPYEFPVPSTTGIILSTIDNTDWVMSVEGNLNTGNITQNGITFTQDGIPIDVGFMTNDLDGYNLISNPYPSSISFDNVFNNTPDIDNTMYIWNHIAGNYGQYTVGGAGTLDVTENIQVGQSFFVQAVNPNPSITFNNSWRQHSNNVFLHPTENLNTIYLTANGNGFVDESVLFFNDNLDYDTKKWFGLSESTEIWFEPENTVKTYPSELPIGGGDIPVYFKSGVDGNYNIVANLDNFQFDWIVDLEDTYDGITHNFNENPVYEFVSSPNDNYYDRFILHLSIDIVDIPENDINNIRVYSYNKTVNIIGDFNNVKIYDLTGKKIVDSNYNKIHIENVGIYIVNVDGVSTKVFIF